MVELGYRESETVTYIFDGVPVDSDKLKSALLTMVDGGVDLIFTAGTPTRVAAHRVTARLILPVVFGVIADPIEAGVITDFNSPWW